MKTFAVVDGDLRVKGRGYALVHGVSKTSQDIGISLREAYGGDRFHPQYGSLLPEMIGEIADDFTRQRIDSEVKRVVANYTAVQQEEVARIRALGEHHDRARMSEVVVDIDKIEVRPVDFGRFDVLIILRSADDRRFSLTTRV